jgi:hypothetical protein
MLSELELAMFQQADSQRIKAAMETGLLVQREEGWAYGRTQIGRTGLVAPNDMNVEEYTDLGRFLLDIGSRLNWLLGDWLAYGDNREWGETYQQVAEQFGYSSKTLREYAYVCRNVNLSIRMDKLTFAHHQVVAALEAEAQHVWLTRALENGWSVATLRKAIQQANMLADGNTVLTERPILIPLTWRQTWEKLSEDERESAVEEVRQVLAEMEAALKG